jgi:hypothetical protein
MLLAIATDSRPGDIQKYAILPVMLKAYTVFSTIWGYCYTLIDRSVINHPVNTCGIVFVYLKAKQH